METDILSKIGGEFPSEELPPIEVEEFRKVVHTRRSVRIYDSSPVPEKVMQDAFDLALLAPSSSNLQPWEFFWVRSPEKRKAMVEACLSQPAAQTAAELVVLVAHRGTWKRNRAEMLRVFSKSKTKVPDAAVYYYQKLIPMALSQGVLGIFGLLKKIAVTTIGLWKPIPREPFSHSDMRVWAAKSSALAAENFMLAVRAHGFDSCPMEGLDSARVRRILGLPCSSDVVMAISVGKRAKNGVYGPRIRFDRSWFIKEI